MTSPVWPLTLTFAGLLGVVIGSFLNVCIYRLPRGESIIAPRSRCVGCLTQLSWFENIPLLSFILLRGRCRHCQRPISWRYPVVELLTALLSVVLLVRFPYLDAYLIYFLLFTAPLLVITFIDLEHLIIPDVISFPGIAIGFASSLYLGRTHLAQASIHSSLGILLGAGSLWLLGWIYERIRGQIGLGLGDVKLAAMLGAFLGAPAILFILLLSALLGTLIGGFLTLLTQRRWRQPLPYGPFLALAGWIYLFWGGGYLRII